MKSKLLTVLYSCLVWAVLFGPAPRSEASGPIACGGIAGLPCPGDSTCVDVPGDGCTPDCGGADCPGFCAETPRLGCGGFVWIPCPFASGLTCVDDPDDKCTPDCGGADCPGVCVQVDDVTCAGFIGAQCAEGFECVDSSGDACNPGCGGADCTGICIRNASPFCGGIANIPCSEGLVCIDAPDDGCNNECGGADCGGICVDPVLACGRSDAPECGGACPSGQECLSNAAGDACGCQPGPASCSASSAPMCGGECPDGSRCAPISVVPDGACQCLSCAGVVPGSDIAPAWPAKEFLVWDELPCAEFYNSYRITARRLVDLDGNGLADDYGSCLQDHLMVPSAADPSDPPPKFTHFYLITGGNAIGEGALGFNSDPTMRQNATPCP